ncbi:OX-2 membrane glycoprotein-like, partial [Arapaima gigas]
QGSTEADFGEKVTFSCRLSESRGVRQVTWLRLRSSGSVDSLASYSPHHGAAVSEQFLGRVLLTEVTLHSTSITLQNVTLEDEGCYICTFNIYPGGSTRKQTCLTHVVGASVGGEVQLKCELTEPKEVLQVTWQRVTKGMTENVASYSKRHGVKIREPFRDHVRFQETGFQECSIAIERVKWEDESCYKCLFNAYPEGAITGTTCLKVYELQEPMLEIRQTVGDDGLCTVILSCSVTGRPAPEVSLDVTGADLRNVTSMTLHNNGTTTITKSATVLVDTTLSHTEVQVRCIAEQPFGVSRKESYRNIPPMKQDTSDPDWNILAAVLGIIVLMAIVGAGLWLHRKRSDRSSATPGSSSHKINIESPSPQTKQHLETQSSLKKRRSAPSSPTNNSFREFEERNCKRSLFSS